MVRAEDWKRGKNLTLFENICLLLCGKPQTKPRQMFTTRGQRKQNNVFSANRIRIVAFANEILVSPESMMVLGTEQTPLHFVMDSENWLDPHF